MAKIEWSINLPVTLAELEAIIDRTREEERANAHEMQDKAVATERERCAKIAEGLSRMGNAPSHPDAPKMIAVAIRGPETGQEGDDTP